MEEALIRLCGVYGVPAGRICGLTGVWCHLRWGGSLDQSCDTMRTDEPKGERKIGAIGIHVSRGVTSHGFAFNVTTDLRDFLLINPCGITDRPVTSLAREVENAEALPGLEQIAHQAARQFGLVFNEQVLALESLAALRALAKVSEPAQQLHGQQFPAQDMPLEVPREVERLRNPKDRPVNA